jgi:hypothetical protein
VSTGRRLLHDPRSRAYAAPQRALSTTSWLHRLGPVLDQGTTNGCTGFAAANWLNAAVAVGNRRRYNTRLLASFSPSYLDAVDGLELYTLATTQDPFKWTYPPTDGGSSGLGVAKALKSLGVIDRYTWTFSFPQMLAHGARQPVLLGLVWTEAMNDPGANGIIRIGTERQLRKALDAELGHEVLLRGVNWPRKLARIRNQWTADWGIKGEALIPLDDLERLIIECRGDVCVPEVVAS